MNGTELILNKDQSLYHLNLKPGDISDLIITVGDPDRVEKVSRHFDSVDLKRSGREFVTHTGTIGSRRVSVVSTGIGTDNVDIVVNELHVLHRASQGKFYDASQLSFVRLGTSGAVQTDIELDSLLISEFALGLDTLLQFYRWEHLACEVAEIMRSDDRWRNLPRPYATQTDAGLLEYFNPMADLRGVTITTPGFYAPQGRSVNLMPRVVSLVELFQTSRFKGQRITNIEMETAGIYGMASLLGHRAISISAILANRVTGDFSQKPEETVDRMIAKALEIIPDIDS